ncbi:MAG: co-chaperone DjlA [Candidatus Competibacteraceae bacterium]|nr:co-chaperone DjlA [Candidatus Competibacteraceae bacterium]
MLGKLFGGAFGFVVGGPLGALLGAAVGHNLDHNLNQKTWKIGADAADGDPNQQVPEHFVRIAFELMGYIAKADGRVSEAEIKAARAIMDHLHLNSGQRQAAIDCFTVGKQPTYPLNAALETLRRVCAKRFMLLHQLLEMQLNIAYADGALHPQTHERLLNIVGELGIPRLQFEALHNLFRARHQHSGQQHYRSGAGQTGEERAHHRRNQGSRPTTAVNSLSQAYAVLGLKREASIDEIKLAYRRLIKRHHPDKLAASETSPAELKKATEKTREITAAYERIREARGF